MAHDRAVEVERTAWLMGTTLTARAVAADRETAAAAIGAAFDEVGRIEAVISTWDPDTPLSRLNRAPVGEPVPVDPELLAMLLEGERLAVASGRAFEPAVGPLIDAWGVRGEPHRPGPAEIADALAAVRAGFALDAERGTATRGHPAAWIDTGAFGKGFALEAAARVLTDRGVVGALLDFGGQVLAFGESAAGGAWRIAVAHPARRDEAVAELRPGAGLSVATSGGSERPGHLLDPRTGASLPAWGSVTVVSPDPVAADALATALFVMGPEEGSRWARDLEGAGVLFLEDAAGGLRASWTPAMETWLDPSTLQPDTFGKRDPS